MQAELAMAVVPVEEPHITGLTGVWEGEFKYHIEAMLAPKSGGARSCWQRVVCETVLLSLEATASSGKGTSFF